jgi:heme/copper-type cytochrome/quinol oxidase subunit 2
MWSRGLAAPVHGFLREIRAIRAILFLREIRSNPVISVVLICLLTATAFALQEQTPNRRDVTIVAHKSRFEPNHITVSQNDLVRVMLKSEKLPRTFAIDAYRISKRVSAGESVTFEFHANQAGTFTYYCNLTSVPACREMKGTLVVSPK